jgi:ribosome biogenesis protein MAK21
MLEEASRDSLDFLKEKALRALAQLLIAKPEQEARLLAALVNKLGDTSRRLASKVSLCLSGARAVVLLSPRAHSPHSSPTGCVIGAAPRGLKEGAITCMQAGYLLRTVLDAHPSMKLVMAREVERFMFRPNLQERARYYSVIFLNQMPLSHNPVQGAILHLLPACAAALAYRAASRTDSR